MHTIQVVIGVLVALVAVVAVLSLGAVLAEWMLE